MGNNSLILMLLTKPPAQLAVQFLTPIMWSRFLLILCLVHSTIARPQGQVDTLTSFFPENQLGETSGTQLKTPGDTSSDSNLATQPPWTEDPKPILFAGTGCNNASPIQIPHSRSRRSFSKRGEEMCSPDDRNQLFKQPNEGQQSVRDAAQPLPLNPTSINPQRPARTEKPPKGIHPMANSMYLAIYNFPGMDGQPDEQVCATSQNPLLRVPICAPPQPYTPLPFVLPARFCKLHL